MRILWVGKGSNHQSKGGDEVYDRKILQRLMKAHEIVRFNPRPLNKRRKLLNLLRGVPIYRATYRSRENVEGFRSLLKQSSPDVIVISWEPFDFLANYTESNVILLLHNITSDAIVEVFKQTVTAKIYAAYIRQWERRVYSKDHVQALVVLSRHDATVVQKITLKTPVVIVPPGAPLPLETPVDGPLPELFISGTYDWFPKRRDLITVSEEISKLESFPLSVFWDQPVPENVGKQLIGGQREIASVVPAIRFGLVPDTFSSGFKLKVTSYIANNCIVLSRASVIDDYRDIPFASIFIRRINSMSEVSSIYKEFCEMNCEKLRAEFEEFKNACLAHFTWDGAATEIGSLLNKYSDR